MKFAAGVLTSMFAMFAAVFFWPAEPAAVVQAATSNTFPCTVSSITDGDTFQCQETGADGKQIRIRLSGIAARERDGSCTKGHPCPTASAEAATAQINSLALAQPLQCREVGVTYGRIAAFCALPDGKDLSCAMVESGMVEKWDRYWGDHSCT
jgi:endonuclease YncB( thermonuclease family)